ncbi:MAG: trypsin-like peptidase domain-containing protein [Pirellulales bacterium]|nr:trypsin-like peptidase domain-containing protein [Pirellulales bacterium]
MQRHARISMVVVCVAFSFFNSQRLKGSADSLRTDSLRVADWSFLFGGRHRALYESSPGEVTPHPAVARIIVPEADSTAYGSGTLVGVREDRGLVVTNWHVVRDATGLVEIVFPDGFRSNARPLKVDQDWDLAALVVWKPNAEPVKIASQPPRPGDLLTIHGYGRGQYRIATGRCTTYYAPQPNFPHEMVELDAEARQGDSGGPIFNQAGELAGVLFGAGQGTTMGSFAPRVRHFLAAIAPDLDQPHPPNPRAQLTQAIAATHPVSISNVAATIENESVRARAEYPSSPWVPPNAVTASGASRSAEANTAPAQESTPAKNSWYESTKSALAVVGILAILLGVVKVVT